MIYKNCICIEVKTLYRCLSVLTSFLTVQLVNFYRSRKTKKGICYILLNINMEILSILEGEF